MRMKRSRMEMYYHRKKITKKDGEGSTYSEYENATGFQGEMWPASGKLQAETYGNRLSYIRNVKIDGRYEIKPDEKGVLHYLFENDMDITEGDGMCLYVSKSANPDYAVISIKPYKHLLLEVEKL